MRFHLQFQALFYGSMSVCYLVTLAIAEVLSLFTINRWLILIFALAIGFGTASILIFIGYRHINKMESWDKLKKVFGGAWFCSYLAENAAMKASYKTLLRLLKIHEAHMADPRQKEIFLTFFTSTLDVLRARRDSQQVLYEQMTSQNDMLQKLKVPLAAIPRPFDPEAKPIPFFFCPDSKIVSPSKLRAIV